MADKAQRKCNRFPPLATFQQTDPLGLDVFAHFCFTDVSFMPFSCATTNTTQHSGKPPDNKSKGPVYRL